VPVAIEASTLAEELVFVNGGQRGLQVRLDPKDVQQALDATAAPIVA
jgi:Cys-tRNA(Pro)/Cys-tRNA(Cys) deacylase